MIRQSEGLIVYILIPVAAVVVGGLSAAIRAPGPRFRSMIQHFAAGVVLAAVAGELLPEITSQHAPWAVFIGFGLGITVMLVVRTLTERGEHSATEEPSPTGLSAPQRTNNLPQGQSEAKARSPMGLIMTLGVDIVIDGLLIGIGFAAGAKTGAILTLALTFEAFFLGLSAAVGLSEIGAPRARMIGTAVGLAALLAVGGITGALLLGQLAGPALATVLAFGAAALLFLVTEELLLEAHEVPETHLSTTMFFMGFLALLMFETVA